MDARHKAKWKGTLDTYNAGQGGVRKIWAPNWAGKEKDGKGVSNVVSSFKRKGNVNLGRSPSPKVLT